MFSVPSFAKTADHLMHCTKKQLLIVSYCWTNSSMSAFISSFFFLQSTGILVYNDGPHVSSGSSWTRCPFLCHCVLHVCCKQTKECAFPQPVSRLLCLCSAPLSLMKLLHDANEKKTNKCLVLKV